LEVLIYGKSQWKKWKILVSLKSRDKPKDDKESEQATVQYLMKTLENLQKENEILKRDLLKSKRTPTGKIGFILLAIGALTLAGSVINTSTVLAFIGLGLTFWGALFLFARPVKFVKSTLLDSTAISSYTTIDRMIRDLSYKGKPIYIPPYPKEAYLPEYLKGLKEMIVFIPVILENPKGICIAPPGYGLVSLFERELKTEFTQISIDELYNSLPTIIVNNLELAEEFEINPEKDLIHVKIVNSVYNDLYANEQNIKSIHSIGCPLTSAIACALAKTTGKLIVVVKDLISPDSKTIEIWYQTLEA